MSMTPANFLLMLPLLSGEGKGILQSVPIAVTELKTSTGLTLTTITAPAVAVAETNAIVVEWADGSVTPAILNWVVPQDYHQDNDTLILSLMANSNGNTDTPTMSATVYNKRVGTAISSNLAPAASAAIPTKTALASEVTITVSGKGLKGGDVLTILLYPGTHNNDAVDLYGLSIKYRSSLVAYDPILR